MKGEDGEMKRRRDDSRSRESSIFDLLRISSREPSADLHLLLSLCVFFLSRRSSSSGLSLRLVSSKQERFVVSLSSPLLSSFDFAATLLLTRPKHPFPLT